MVGYCIRQMMNDQFLLDKFRRREVVDVADIRRRLILCERSYHPEINDNLLQKALEYYVPPKSSHAAFFTKGLKKLAEELITKENNHLRVKMEKLESWHDALTYCSPLLLLAAWSTDSHDSPDGSFVDEGIVHTALIPPTDQSSSLEGIPLYDLHLHLNGSTELDVMWQDALMFPEKYRHFFARALKKPMVVEQVEQLYPKRLDSSDLFELLQEARSLRWYIVHYLLRGNPDSASSDMKKDPVRDFAVYQDKYQHPLSRDENKDLLLSLSVEDRKSFLQGEYWMYVLVFRRLSKRGEYSKGAELAKWFHYYLLILGLMNQMVVQQTDQYGFRQFQKITANDLRRNSEQDYRDRFKQLLSVDGDMAKTRVERLEGRFAPKENPRLDFLMLQRIHKGIKEINNGRVSCALVSHFIKRPVDRFDQLRYDKVRRSLWVSCIALDSLLSDRMACERLHLDHHPIVAIDAASSEFDTPPEVFAPVFRYLRERHEELQFTYHSGEDFYHPLSGLRAIYEAVTFLGYREYDRIGHATALGIDPSLWFHRMPHSLYLSKEEWVDDLLFCIHILELQPSTLYDRIVDLLKELRREKNVDIDLLTQAWLARKWDPDCVETPDPQRIDYYKKKEFWDFRRLALTEDVKTELLEHWTMRNYDELNEPVLVDDSVISAEVITRVQQKMMALINSKGIYLESLPTSNLRISIYKCFEEHHLKNWINEKSIEKYPRIVLGTDDPGIFATNLLYEYSHVAQMYKPENGKFVIQKIVKDSQELVSHQIKSKS